MTQHVKVFGIGFQKTATSSLAAALYILGYNVTGYFGSNDPNIQENVYDTAYQLADRYDAAQDTPWPVLFKELDARYPHSKFILTIRESDKWVKSVVKHFKKHRIPSHEWIYGVPMAKGYEDAYVQRYEAHNLEVLEYFKDRPDDLLVIDITKGAGWREICPFLEKPIPPVNFPLQNTSTEKSNQLVHRGVRFIKRKIPLSFVLKEDDMKEGVSAAFVRDILHYHYAMYAIIWDGIDAINDHQFTQEFPFSRSSIHDLLIDQMSLEETWLHRLQGETSPVFDLEEMLTQSPYSKEKAKAIWQTNQALLRNYVANMSDELCNAKLPDQNGIVWEAFVDMMNKGTENRVKIKNLLQFLTVEVEDASFVNFFNTPNKKSLAF